MKPVDPRVPPALVPSGSRAVLIGEKQTDTYVALPSIRTPNHRVVTRWELSAEEREAIAEGEDIFLTILADGPLQPVRLSVGPEDWTKG